jgi:hypothetical protein
VYPQWRNDEHLIIRSSDGGFQVDISARPIWLQGATEPTRIVITAAILSNGTVAMAYTLSGPEYPEYSPRTGVRLNDGTIQTFQQYGITQTTSRPQLAAEPTDEAPFTPVESETTTRTEDTDRESTADTDRELTEDTDRESTTGTDRNAPFIPEGATVTNEGSFVQVVAPEGQRIASAVGYYGDPNDSTRGGEVSSILFELLAGETSTTIEVSNETFGNDPAPGTPKVLILLVVYEDIPIIPTPEQPTTPEQEPVVEPSPEPTTIPPTEEPTPEPTPSEEPVEEPTENEPEPLPEPEQTEEPGPVDPEEEPITSAEELPVDISAEELMSVNLDEIIATELTAEQAEALIEAALEVFETAEPGSEEYQQALEALFVAAQQDDIVLDEALAAIPLLGDVLGGATELINFLGNAGADMSPEVREDSEKVVVTAIVAVQAALSAVSISGIATTVNLRNGA